jgi:hypothetical protein
MVTHLLNPDLLFEAVPALIGYFLSGLILTTLYRALAALLAVNFHSAADDQARWVAVGKQTGKPHTV